MNVHCIQALVEHGADVNIADRLGNTPLHTMCADVKGQGTVPDCISLLVREREGALSH